MVVLNERVAESRAKLSALPADIITQMSDFLVSELGEPTSPLEEASLDALHTKDYDATKRYCLADPCNSYLAALSCIASAYRSPMVADSVLRDAARHVSEVSKLKTSQRISKKFQSLLQL